MNTIASTAALNTSGIPTLVLVPLIMVISIASVVGISWLYKKINDKK